MLVVAVNDPATEPLRAVTSEGPLWPQHHRPTGPAIVERLRWAGLELESTDRAEPTDARAAMLMGYRAVAFCGGGSTPSARAAEHAADVLETVVRWFGADLNRLSSDSQPLRELTDQMRTAP